MPTPQMGIFLSEAQNIAANSMNHGASGGTDESGLNFGSSFEQAMGQMLPTEEGNDSPLHGAGLPPATEGAFNLNQFLDQSQLDNSALSMAGLLQQGQGIESSLANMQLPEGMLADLQASLEQYFSELGDLSSLSDQELKQALNDIAQQFMSIGSDYGLKLDMSSVQTMLQGFSESQGQANAAFARSMGLDMTPNGMNLMRNAQQTLAPQQGSIGAQPLTPATDSSSNMLDSLHLLKQTVEAQTLASSSVVDGLMSMASNSAATSMSASLDALTADGLNQSPVQLYSQPQQSAVEDAEMSLQRIPVPPTNRQFPQELSERIMVMATKNIQTAEIQLTPPELGSLMVKINVENDQASVVFSSPNSGVREALEQQSFRLKDMLDEKGMDLVDVDVSDQQKDQSQADEVYAEQQGKGGPGDDADVESFIDNLDEQKAVTGSLRLVDYYA